MPGERTRGLSELAQVYMKDGAGAAMVVKCHDASVGRGAARARPQTRAHTVRPGD